MLAVEEAVLRALRAQMDSVAVGAVEALVLLVRMAEAAL